MTKTVLVSALGILLLSGCGAEVLSVNERIERARILSDRDRIDESLQILKEVVAQEPKNARAFYLTGVTLEKRQSFELAKAAYDDCLKIEPSNSDALNNRGVIFAKLGDSEAALKDLLQATSLNSDDSLAWANLALAQHDRGMNQEAIASYQRAIAIRKDARFLFQLGNVFLDMANWDEAEAAYNASIESDGQNANVLLNRATVLIEKNKFDLARQDIARVKALDNDLVYRSSIEDRLKLLALKESPQKETSRVSQWLETKGWRLEAKGDSASLLTATRIVDSVTSGVVIMRVDDLGRVVCDAMDSEAAMKASTPVMLLIIDPRLFASTESAQGENPLWLVDSNFDWKPAANEFSPQTVVYRSAAALPPAAPLPPK